MYGISSLEKSLNKREKKYEKRSANQCNNFSYDANGIC